MKTDLMVKIVRLKVILIKTFLYYIKRGIAKERIIKVLKKHPEGLILTEMSNLTEMSKITMVKYLHELIGEGKIRQRKIGSAKMCYLK